MTLTSLERAAVLLSDPDTFTSADGRTITVEFDGARHVVTHRAPDGRVLARGHTIGRPAATTLALSWLEQPIDTTKPLAFIAA